MCAISVTAVVQVLHFYTNKVFYMFLRILNAGLTFSGLE